MEAINDPAKYWCSSPDFTSGVSCGDPTTDDPLCYDATYTCSVAKGQVGAPAELQYLLCPVQTECGQQEYTLPASSQNIDLNLSVSSGSCTYIFKSYEQSGENDQYDITYSSFLRILQRY